MRKPPVGDNGTGSRRGRASTFDQKISPTLLKSIPAYGEFISVVDVADVFGVTTQTVRKWIAGGYLPEAFVPIGYTDRKLYVRTGEIVSKIAARLPQVS